MGRSILIQQSITNLIAINQTDAEKWENTLILSPLFLRDGDIKQTDVMLTPDFDRMIIGLESDMLWEGVKN